MIYDDKKFIGKVIKTARKSAGLSQEALCEKLGMTDKNLGNIENGRQFPQVNNFLKIIETLNLTIEDFGVKLAKTNSEADLKTNLIKKILLADEKTGKAYLLSLNTVDEILGEK